MASSTTTTTKDPDPGNVQGQQLSTNEQNTPVPYIAGTRKISVTWISRIYNQRSVKVSSGKK